MGKKYFDQEYPSKGGDAEKAHNIDGNGICNVASGLVIFYVDQDTSMLRESIQYFCFTKGIDLSMFCTILR